nr:precorrin-3B C(17)-methyltransferase [Bradyrhizobium aeschynomenes]
MTIVGVGPGRPELITLAASAAIADATDLIGYGPYLDRVTTLRAGQTRHASDNRVELDRARHALALACAGKQVAVVSGGDPGVFAMAAAVFEAVEAGPSAWRDLDIRVEPGVTAMLAAAAEVGAPLGGDFCAISLSDNLKSWATIRRRLEAAAAADFVIALYNPLSRARPHQLGDAFALLRQIKPSSTVVVMVRAAGSGDVRQIITTLGDVDPDNADMRTLVLIGSTATRLIEREGKAPFVYTLRREVEGGA